MTSICAHGSAHGSMMSPSGFVVNSGQPNSTLLSTFTTSNANHMAMRKGVIISSNSSPNTKTTSSREEPRAPVERPQRPLSAYNLFFRRERARMIQSTEESVKPASNGKKKMGSRRGSPSRKVGFAEMARTVAQRWKRIDPQEKQVFEQMASIERARYFKAIEEWKKALHNEVYEDDEDDSAATSSLGEVQKQTTTPIMMIPGTPPRTEEPKSNVGGPHLQSDGFGDLLHHANCISNVSSVQEQVVTFKDSSYHVPEAQLSSMRMSPQVNNSNPIMSSHPLALPQAAKPPLFVPSPVGDNVEYGTSEVNLSKKCMPYHAHNAKDRPIMSHHSMIEKAHPHVTPASPLMSSNIVPTLGQSTKTETETFISSEQPIIHLESADLIGDLAVMLGDDGINFFVNLFR